METAYQLCQPSLGLLMLGIFPLVSQSVLLLLKFWVHAFLEFAEDLARRSNQYSCPNPSKGIKDHILSLTSSPESSGFAIEAPWIGGRAPHNLLNIAAACQEISAFVNADISLVMVLCPELFYPPVPNTSHLSQHHSSIIIFFTQTLHLSNRNTSSNDIIQPLLPHHTLPRTSTTPVHPTSPSSWPREQPTNE